MVKPIFFPMGDNSKILFSSMGFRILAAQKKYFHGPEGSQWGHRIPSPYKTKCVKTQLLSGRDFVNFLISYRNLYENYLSDYFERNFKCFLKFDWYFTSVSNKNESF